MTGKQEKKISSGKQVADLKSEKTVFTVTYHVLPYTSFTLLSVYVKHAYLQ